MNLEMFKIDGCMIEYIKNPSEEVQIMAVRKNSYVIKYINNPSEQVQLKAVENNGMAIIYITNPSLEVQIEAVKNNGVAIKHINYPSKKLQMMAIKQNGKAIEYIKNPCKEVQDMIDIIQCENRELYVLKLEDGTYRFSIGCQANITKEQFMSRIYNENGGLKQNPHRKEYLDILKQY